MSNLNIQSNNQPAIMAIGNLINATCISSMSKNLTDVYLEYTLLIMCKEESESKLSNDRARTGLWWLSELIRIVGSHDEAVLENKFSADDMKDKAICSLTQLIEDWEPEQIAKALTVFYMNYTLLVNSIDSEDRPLVKTASVGLRYLSEVIWALSQLDQAVEGDTSSEKKTAVN